MPPQFGYPTAPQSGGSDIPDGTGYVYQDPPGTFASLASIPGSDLDAGTVTNAKLQYSTVTLTQPAAGLTITNSVALGGTATFGLADDLAAVEALSTTGFVKRTGISTWGTQAAISLATDVTGSLGGSSIADGTVTNAKLQNSSVTLSQPAAGLTVTSSLALGGTATFALADDLAGIEAITGTGLVQRTGTNTYATTTAPAISGANFSSATIGVGSLAFSATSRMLPDTSIALANVMITGNGTSWTNTTSAGANYIMTSGATVASWQNSLTGITINGSTNTITNLTTSMLASGFTLAATQGGTGQTSYAVGDLLYASTTTALSKLAAGTSGHVLTANGASSAPSYQAPVTGTTGSASLSTAQYDLTGSTYEDVGLSVTLPSTGTYLVTANVRTFAQTSASPPGYITVKLYNSTDAADVANSERFGAVDYTNNGSSMTVTISEVVPVAASKTIKVYAKRNAGPTFTNSGVASDATGRSRITYVKLSS